MCFSLAKLSSEPSELFDIENAVPGYIGIPFALVQNILREHFILGSGNTYSL